MNRKFQIYLFCLLTYGISACSVTRHIDDDEHLLYRVSYEGLHDKELKSGLNENLGYRVNKKILSVYPFYLQAWNFGKDGRDTANIREFVREKIGEKPSILDSSKLALSTNKLEVYLFNNGYFNAMVTYEVHTRKRKAFVKYTIVLNQPYTVGDIEYAVYDRDLHKIIMEDTSGSKIKTGDIFDTEKMSQERDRIAQYVRNRGYYFFNKESISFAVDSNQGNHTVALMIEVKNPGMFERHEVYQFNEIYVDIDYPYYIPSKDDSTFTEIGGIHVRTRGMPIKKELFPVFVGIREGDLYSDIAVFTTYNRLYGLQVFGATRIEMTPDTGTKRIDVYIYLTPDPTMLFSVEPQFITSDQSSSVAAGNQRIWGLSGQVTFRNKNLFRGAELLDLTYSGAAEFQYTNKAFVLSNVQQSVTTSLQIPKFLWIENTKFIKKTGEKFPWQRPNTNFNIVFSYQFNPDFVQRTSIVNFFWTASRGFNFFKFIPMELNLNQVDIRSSFLDSLTPGDRVLLSSLLNPNFIPSCRFEWYYNDKGLSLSGNFHRFSLTVEPAGTLTYGTFWLNSRIQGTARPPEGYQVFNTNLFTFTKIDFNLYYYTFPDPDFAFAYRLHTGVGIPYLNQRVIPFDKRFFIGGANSLRGWAPRSIGPGTYGGAMASQIDRSGEIVIEGSAEFRFRVISHFLEGALFADAGNIWNVKADSALDGAEFTPLFFNQFALNTGIGARFDFEFILVRLDMGTQLRDPSFPLNGGWVINDFNYFNRRVTFNFAIGYPF